MAVNCSWTLKDLEDLEKAIGKGILTVKYSDKSITYRSVEEMFLIRNEMRKCLGLSAKGFRLKIHHSKGFC